MFRTRLVSGIILVAATLVTIIVSGPLLLVTLMLLSLVGMDELYKAAGVRDTLISPLAVMSGVCAVIYYLLIFLGVDTRFMVPAAAIGFILLMAVYVFTWPRYQCEQVFASAYGIIYVAVMLSCIYLTRRLPMGEYTVWLIFISSWGCDTFAYCVGMLIGKHRMSPKLSPKKSVEGAVGGVIGAALLGSVYAFAIGGRMPIGAPVWQYALICAAGALISMVGDLAASAIKRNKGIKDYGTLIPGHGGVLDRFDSVIFTAPIIYLLAMLLIN